VKAVGWSETVPKHTKLPLVKRFLLKHFEKDLMPN